MSEKKKGSGPAPGRVVDWDTRPEGPQSKMVSTRIRFDALDILEHIKKTGKRGAATDFVNEAILEKWEREKGKS